MSVVDSPKGTPNAQDAESVRQYQAGLDQLKKQASANVAEVKQTEGKIQSEKALNEGQKAEGRRAEAGAEAEQKNTGTTEGALATEIAGNTLIGTAGQIATTISAGLSDKSSNPAKSIQLDDVSAKMGGMLGSSAKTTSFEDGFKTIKKFPTGNINSPIKGASLLEKTEFAGKSLGGQKDTNVGTVANEKNISQLETEGKLIITRGIANEKVLAQVQQAEAKNAHLPSQGLGSNAPTLRGDARMAKGPAYICPEKAARKQAEMDAGKETDWTS